MNQTASHSRPASSAPLPCAKLPLRAPGGRLSLLSPVRVLDLTTSLAGPYATALLADLGAEVIKIERPGVGDDSRHWRPPELAGKALWFSAVNRNKRSVTLDYARAEGREVLLDLARQCDVVITNQLPKVQEKLGVNYEAMRAVRPDIVFVALSGFGQDGPRANAPCYDLIAEGYSGVMDLTGEAGGDPQKVGTPAADLLGGQDAALACLAALMDRARTGNGHFVDVALVDSMTRFMAPRLMSYLGSGDLPRRSGAKDSVIAVYQVFATADEPITLGLANDNVWRRFCTATGLAGLLEDPSLKDNAGRVAHRARLVDEVARVLATQGRDHWLGLFAHQGVPAGPINRLDEVASDAELHRRGLLYAIDDGGVPVPQVGLGIRFDGHSAGYDIPPPDLGQHTGEVLTDLLGYSAARVAELKEKGLI
ncbi:CoA transferase [Xanthobacter autotrophicus]|uniref:CaiB/BaiF CoA transferase family protein n=1 Tax=Xanthobacter autotrophicus TaxID=280 RepID=UPI00372CC91C